MGADLRMEGALISAHVGYARADAVERLNTPLYFLVAPPAQDIFALDDPLSTGLSSLLKTAGVFPMRLSRKARSSDRARPSGRRAR